jgi:hypothetical protein
MKTVQTLEQQIESLKQENELKMVRKIEELKIKEQLLQLTGLDFMVLIHSEKSISAWIENDQYNGYSKFDRTQLKSYYDAICTVFKPICKPLTFASSKQIENFAPAKIDIENHFSEITLGHTQVAKFEFNFENGLHVSFKMPFTLAFKDVNTYSFNVEALNPYAHTRDGRKEKRCYYLTVFGKVAMYGKNYYHYARNEEEAEKFMNFIFTGIA